MKKSHVPIKRIAAWLDHSEARILQRGEIVEMSQTIYAPGIGHEREAGEGSDKTQVGRFRSSNNEHAKNEKAKKLNTIYFKKLAETILPYDEILLFGPTTAKEELYNYLLKTKKFTGKIIHVKHADYLTNRQLVAFVKKNLI